MGIPTNWKISLGLKENVTNDMKGTKQRICYRKSRKGKFCGKRKREESFHGLDTCGADAVPTIEGPPVHSPPIKNRSLEKIKSSCPKEEDHTTTRRRALALGYHCETDILYGNY